MGKTEVRYLVKNRKWIYVAIPEKLVEKVDAEIEKDKYPMGKYRSRNHYVLVAVKEKLRREEGAEEPGEK